MWSAILLVGFALISQGLAEPVQFNNRHGLIPIAAQKDCASGKDNWGNCKEADRAVTTIRASSTDADDISQDLLDGLKKANNGGLLLLEKGKRYIIGKKLDLSFLNDVYVRLDGEIKFTDDVAYWQANNFYFAFQKSITYWVWGGKDIKIFGNGTLNGNGQKWYDGFKGKEITDDKNTYFRPVLFTTDNATNVEVSGIHFLNAANWNTFLVRTKNIAFDRIRMDAISTNANHPKNTDGFDSYQVDGFRVTNSEIDVGDDCVSPKPNTTNIHIENVWCNNTHGISMGSIGQYPGVMDFISNAYIKNVTLLNGQNGARLKAWAGPDRGYGYISNITYEDITIENNDFPVVVDQCYIGVKPDVCKKHPSKVNITDIKFTNIKGSSTGRRGLKVVELKCSPGAKCEGIEVKNVEITSPKSKGQKGLIVCDNIPKGVGVPCVSSAEADKMAKQGPSKDNAMYVQAQDERP